LGAAVTALLVEDAGWRAAETVFLSAGDDAVARVYDRLGFRRVGVHRAAEPAQRPLPCEDFASVSAPTPLPATSLRHRR
jgi:hypothetical protein